jgi:hypothetical protein
MKHTIRDPATGRFITAPPPMRAVKDGFLGHEEWPVGQEPALRWARDAAWLLLGACIGWGACAVCAAVWWVR